MVFAGLMAFQSYASALEAENTVDLLCSSSKVVIQAKFKNNEVGDRYTYNVIPTDKQSNVSAAVQTVNPGETGTWLIPTNLASVIKGTVYFDIQRVDDPGSKIFRLVNYDLKNCAGQPDSTTNVPTPTPTPTTSNTSGKVEVKHQVRTKGSSVWLDKVTNISSTDEIELAIIVTNNSSTPQSVSSTIILPSELIGTSGSTTATLNDIKPGESKEAIVTAKLRATATGSKCLTSTAKIEQSTSLIGTDTAAVCYGAATVSALPTTGPVVNMLMSSFGLFCVFFGLTLKQFPKLADILVK